MYISPLCWLCFLDHNGTPLDEASRCPIHGLVRDRVLGLVRIDERFLKTQMREEG